MRFLGKTRYEASRNILMIFCTAFMGCHGKRDAVKATYNHLDPIYGEIKLSPIGDTLHFPLAEHTYNRIGSFNCFRQNGATYISFYDRGSKSLIIYNFYSGKIVDKTSLYSWVKSAKLDKASVYVKNFDSIYITTQSAFYLLDSAGVVKTKVDFPEEFNKWGYISNTTPLVFKGNLTYIGVKPFIDDKSIESQRRWRPLYQFDMKNKKRNLFYSLPDIYQNGLLGYAFLDYSYCLNDKGNFVFSFAADTNLYETNLSDYHIAYFGRSKFQKGDIDPVSKDTLKKNDGYKIYSLRDSYGAVFFDPYKKRYLRAAKQKLTEAEYQSKTVRKKRSIIIFDEKFQIIGESETGDDFSFDSILFMEDGTIYARTNGSDEHALHFVRLVYEEPNTNQIQLAHQRP